MLRVSVIQIEQAIGEVRALSSLLATTENIDNIEYRHYYNVTSLLLSLIQNIQNKTLQIGVTNHSPQDSEHAVFDILLDYLEQTISYLTLTLNASIASIDLNACATLTSRLALEIEVSFQEWCESSII